MSSDKILHTSIIFNDLHFEKDTVMVPVIPQNSYDTLIIQNPIEERTEVIDLTK